MSPAPSPRAPSSLLGVVLGGLALGLAAAPLSACNTIATGPTPECSTDADCGTGALCSLAQGNICVPEVLPPRTVLAFDILDGDLHVELNGCDPEVSRELGGSELRVQKYGQIVEAFQLRPESEREVEDCADCSGECDDQSSICVDPMDLTIGLSSESRLGLARLTQPSQSYLTMPDPPLPEGELPSALEFNWAAYDSLLTADHPIIRVDGTPGLEHDSGVLHRALPEGSSVDGEIAVTSQTRCQRGLFSTEGVRTISGAPVAGAEIEFTHDEPVGSTATVLGPNPGSLCVDDLDCSPGWTCGDDSRCSLDLRGLSAGSTTSLEDGTFLPAWMYTYCEGLESPVDDPLTRDFLVRVTPPDGSGLPTTLYSLEQDFPDPPSLNASRQYPMAGQLCLPDWAGPTPVDFSVAGTPVELLDTSLGTYSCCTTECLPTGDPDVEPPPPPNISSCDIFERARFETSWTQEMSDLEWEGLGCLPTAEYSDGSSGRYVRDINACEDGEACTVALTTGDADPDAPLTYTYTITQPVDSVFRSARGTFEFDGDAPTLDAFELEPRVLLRGRITCATGNDNCSAVGALLAAERLRSDGEDDPPGPYFFQTPVDASGNFVLPVDPGVYVVTAYPAVGQPGGPAPYDVLDLREDSPLVSTVDGIPNVTIAAPFELDDGLLVRVELRDFDSSTTVTPIDTGSWTAQADELGYDLNDPGTCYGPPRRGCLVRRLLRPSQAPISLSITKRLQFTTRDAGSGSCPD